jgi:phytoene synthase
MSQPRPSLAASYAFCRQAVRQARSSFTPCFWLLSRPKHEAMEALYAFMRHTDDLADSPRPAAERRVALRQWRAALDAALAGSAAAPKDLAGLPLLPALADTVERFGIPKEHLHAVIDGVEMDLDRRFYETFDDLTEYCRRVASAVGLACIYVWGFRGDEAFRPADQCGVAFQLTNILRDLKEDTQQGRVYLPLEDLRVCGYSADDLAQGVADERFDRLMALETDRAERLYREGAELARYLEPDGRRILGMMMEVYHRLLVEIRRRPHDVLARRVRLSRWQKVAIALRWTLWPP